MKRLWILLIVSALCASTSLFAQEKNPKAMIQERLSFMQKKLLTSTRCSVRIPYAVQAHIWRHSSVG